MNRYSQKINKLQFNNMGARAQGDIQMVRL
jgi:hypothetical protein